MGATPKGISGSRAAAILGKNPWKTCRSVWMDIIEDREPGFCKANGFIREEFSGNAATKWGLAFESEIIRLSEKERQLEIVDQEREFTDSKYPFLTCHIDGHYVDILNNKPNYDKPSIIHEGKTTNAMTYREKWGEPKTDHIPGEYKVQVHHQMILTGAKLAVVSVLVFPERQDILDELGHILNREFTVRWGQVLYEMGYFHQYYVEADPCLHQYMVECYCHFHEKNVLGRTPPDPVNYKDIKSFIIEPKGTVVATDKIYSLAKEYKDIGAELNNAGKRKESLKIQIVKFMIDKHGSSPEDEESLEKIILRDTKGFKLAQYNGKTFR